MKSMIVRGLNRLGEKNMVGGVLALLPMMYLVFGPTSSVMAQSDGARVRVIHASPDAPAVDVLVDGTAAFSGAAFKDITQYAALDAGSYNVQVVPAGETEPAVIEAELDLDAGTDYSVAAVGMLDSIEPLVLVDNNAAPEPGKAHVRFVHASPDAPAVDVAVADGPTLFEGIAFKGVGDYMPVESGSYDLEVRVAGTEDVALSVPGVTFGDGVVYTVFAVGLAGGEPALEALPSVDAEHEAGAAASASETAGESSSEMPQTLPKTGGEDYLPYVMLAAAAFIIGGLVIRLQAVAVKR